MQRRCATLVILMGFSIVLAGCSAPADGTEGAVVDGDALPGTDDSGYAIDDVDGGAAADGASAEAERWYAYTFTQLVRPASGGAGTIQSFRYEMVEERDGQELVLDVGVDVVGVRTIDVRTVRMDGEDFTQSTVTTPLEVTELKHVVRVVRDDLGERAPDATATVHVFVPTQEIQPGQTFLLDFAKMAWTDEDGDAGVLEYFLTPEMEAETDAGEAFFLPYQEGEEDFTAWWAYNIFVMTYAPGWMEAWVDGEEGFEEGEYEFGGYRYSEQRKPLRVSGYTFDGWRVEWSADTAEGTGVQMFEVAPTLPIPVAYNVGGSDTRASGETSSSHWRYQLKDLRLR